MPADPDPPGCSPRHPLLADAATRFQAGIAHVEFRRMVERAQRRLDEDRRYREAVELLHLARLVSDAAAN